MCFSGILGTLGRPRHSYLGQAQQDDKSSILINPSGEGLYDTYWGSITSVKDKNVLAPALETLQVYHDCAGGSTPPKEWVVAPSMGHCCTQHLPMYVSECRCHCFSGLASWPSLLLIA